MSFFFTQPSSEDQRNEKLDCFRKYKFVIAFEDAIEPDYVTDKFFDPLLADSVPVYLGAPNIEEFAPGNNCFVDVHKFKNPQSLAQFTAVALIYYYLLYYFNIQLDINVL
jgi:hypothetical protein